VSLWRTLRTLGRSARRGRWRPDGVAVPGGRARIAWSSRGIPTITAPTQAGAYHALGRIHAHERLWQLDLLRRVGKGELARFLGDQPVPWERTTIHCAGLRLPDLDFFLRAFGIERAAQGTLDRTRPRSRELLETYLRGLNEGLLETRRSLEHALLGVDPEPFSPLDAAVVAKVFAYNLCLAWKAKLAFRALHRALGPGPVLDGLLPRAYGEGWPRIAALAAEVGAPSDAEQGLLAMDEAARGFTGGLGAHLGSNSWVVGGSRTASGKPILCGDPHLEATAPAPFYLARVRGGDLDVAGATIPGLPAVVIGRNARVAWSVTNTMADDCDLYAVPFGEPIPDRPGAPPAALESLGATIEVKGERPRARTIRICQGAALISDAFTAELAFGVGEALAMRWTATEAPGRELDAFLGVNEAGGFEDFRAAVGDMGAPAQNFSYADVDGHIGYVLGGAFPIRRGGPSLVARPLTDPAGDWTGLVPREELPWVLDPLEDVIAHANNEVVAAGYPHYLSCLWDPPHRIRRIVARLAQLEAATPVDAAAIQTDVRSLHGLEFVERFLRPRAEALRELRPDVARVLDDLLAWDGECAPRSVGAAAFHMVYDALVAEVAERPLGPAFVPFREVWAEQLRLLEEFLAGDHPWLEGTSTNEVLARALAAAAEHLERRRVEAGGGGVTWGALHRGTFRHALGAAPVFGRLLSIGPFGAPGSSYTVWSGHYSHAAPFELTTAPALRFVADLSVPEAGGARAVLPTGQSGDPLSPHYRDQLALWLRGETIPLG